MPQMAGAVVVYRNVADRHAQVLERATRPSAERVHQRLHLWVGTRDVAPPAHLPAPIRSNMAGAHGDRPTRWRMAWREDRPDLGGATSVCGAAESRVMLMRREHS